MPRIERNFYLVLADRCVWMWIGYVIEGWVGATMFLAGFLDLVLVVWEVSDGQKA